MSKSLGLSAAVILAASLSASAQTAPTPAFEMPDFSKIEIEVTDLGKGAYMLSGGGGNVTLVVGKDAAILVDDSLPMLTDKLKAKIASITNLPIRFVINTHFHDDHAGGNAAFSKNGAVIAAQENARTRMMKPTYNDITEKTDPPRDKANWPTVVFSDELVLFVDGQTADARYAEGAHTDGDVYVYFKEANVLATGDIYTSSEYPAVDAANGGYVRKEIVALGQMADVINNDTKIVPGHGPVSDKTKLLAFRDMIVKTRDLVAGMISRGRSVDDVVAANPLGDQGAMGGPDRFRVGFLKEVYRSFNKAK